jgi:hypothetical protein
MPVAVVGSRMLVVPGNPHMNHSTMDIVSNRLLLACRR